MPTVNSVAARKFGFLHLGVNFEGVDIEAYRPAVEKVLNKAQDWLRYAPNWWLIYTSRSLEVWQKELVEVPGMKEKSWVICEVNITNRTGWMYKSEWEWINKER
jgi:hypothetical protein